MKHRILIVAATAAMAAVAGAQTNAPSFDMVGPKIGDRELDTQQKQLGVQARANAIDVQAQKSDTVDLTHTVTALYCGGAGNVKMDLAGSGTVTIAVTAGLMLQGFNIKRVYSTLTTATGLVGFY